MEDDKYSQALFVKDVKADKTRIEVEGGRLIDGCSSWILSQPGFLHWAESNPSTQTLWIHGAEGTGKTMHVCFLINYLVQKNDKFPIAYFFFEPLIHEHNTTIDLLRSLIHQLMVHDTRLVKHLRQDYDKYGDRMFGTAPNSVAILSRVLKAMLQDTHNPFYFVVDAVDACTSRQSQILKLISKTPSVKWIVSIRTMPSQKKRSASCCEINLDACPETVQSVQLYVRDKLENMPKLAGRTDEQNAIRQLLELDGTYRWAAPFLQVLKRVRRGPRFAEEIEMERNRRTR